MTIYTKKGDRGETSLYGGGKISKEDILIEAIGNIDELNALIGLLIIKVKDRKNKIFLTNIQKNLYLIMAYLSGANKDLSLLKIDTKKFEQKIDKMMSGKTKLNRFILPQGTELSSLFHLLRTVCRRGERRLISLGKRRKDKNLKEIIPYINRMSDLFYVFARFYNKEKEIII